MTRKLMRMWVRFRVWLATHRWWNDIKQLSWTVNGLGAALLFVGLLGTLNWGWSYPGFISHSLIDFHNRISTELVGIGITVIIIDTAGRWRDIQQEKKRLIREMSSPNNGIALRAVREVRDRGWLKDGSLEEADLGQANLREVQMDWINLREAYLRGANLQGAFLMGTNLEEADLGSANLQRAVLESANLAGANLASANLREGHLGGANLRGADLSSANLQAVSLKDPLLGKICLFDGKTVLPDGVSWTPETDMGRFTDPDHPEFWRSDYAWSPAYRGDDDDTDNEDDD